MLPKRCRKKVVRQHIHNIMATFIHFDKVLYSQYVATFLQYGNIRVYHIRTLLGKKWCPHHFTSWFYVPLPQNKWPQYCTKKNTFLWSSRSGSGVTSDPSMWPIGIHILNTTGLHVVYHRDLCLDRYCSSYTIYTNDLQKFYKKFDIYIFRRWYDYL